MKKWVVFFVIILSYGSHSCRERLVRPGEVLFVGNFKAEEVKEGNIVVYRLGASNNIIPGYSRYRLAFIPDADGQIKKVRITEYNGEVFEGVWGYSSDNSLLTISRLNPTPLAGNFVYKVEQAETSRLVLLNTTPNLKTGETINKYTLIKE